MTTIPLNVSLSVLASLQKSRAHVRRNLGGGGGEGWGWQKFTLPSKMVKRCSVFGCTKRSKGALRFFPHQESKEKRVDGLS